MGKAREELAKIIPTLNQNPKAIEMMQVLPKTICFDLQGEEEKFCVIVRQKQMKLQTKADGEPDFTVYGDANEVAKIVTREREFTHPIAEGKVWVSRGKLSTMLVFDRVLNLKGRG